MTHAPKTQASPLGLVLLSMLSQGPMHAYRMQKLIKQRGKDRVVNVRQRASVYQTLDRLLRMGLIEVQKTVQTESHPDRTIYVITEPGRNAAKAWLREMLVAVGTDFPCFPAAVSVLPLLTPADARKQLQSRAEAVRSQLQKLETDAQEAAHIPPLFLLEDAYKAAVLTAELAWLNGVVRQLDRGSLTWNARWLRAMAAKFSPNEGEESDGE